MSAPSHTGNTINLDDVERFASGIVKGSRGIWFDPHAMAQTMLGMAEEIRHRYAELSDRLRQYDRITLGISVILDDESLSKKQIRERLDDLYHGARA